MEMFHFCPLVMYFILSVCIQDAKLLPYHKISKNNCKESIVFNFKTKYQGYKLPCLQRDALTGMLPDGEKHPCFRKCDDKPMICYYNFHVEWYQSMSKACFDCPLNPSDCNRADCVMADGVSRTVTVVNRKMPGPSIEVCENDIIMVNVTNDLLASGTTIHWHGMHQKDTPFMDGVPFVTQCPIQPESHFMYEFYAKQSGTYFWHSHIGLQRGDGVTGSLIIRQKKWNDRHKNLYDIDDPRHVIQVYDWTKDLATSIYTGHYHSDVEMAPKALLINGRGRFNRTIGNKTIITNAPVFTVTENSTYRFRFINAQFYFCPIELSVDEHNITIIASDGYDLEPVVAKSLVAYAGERFDFIIDTHNKRKANYWIKIRGIMNCENNANVRQVGILHYHGAESDAEPEYGLSWEKRELNYMSVNNENQGEEQNKTTTISKLRSVKNMTLNGDPSNDVLNEKPRTIYVAYDLYKKNNSLFNKNPLYGHKQVPTAQSVPTPQLNHISMALPSSPLLVSRPTSDNFCSNDTFQPNQCKKSFCKCPHVIEVDLNSVIEIIIIDEGNFTNANHPFHLHGHSFRVVGQKRLENSYTTVEEVMELDRKNQIERNLVDPPIKDTVTVPDGGYTIVRFKANNPGYWLFHCHIEFHAEVGMALVFKVGKHDDMVPVPNDFPMCGHFASAPSTDLQNKTNWQIS